MVYPTPDEPDQLGPFEPLHLMASIEVSPATISTSVDPDIQISDTLTSIGPSIEDCPGAPPRFEIVKWFPPFNPFWEKATLTEVAVSLLITAIHRVTVGNSILTPSVVFALALIVPEAYGLPLT
tara:strand:+ start:678 stop:1049 length:372 start_codon:yes stop_codon:yes gene_type:complete